MKYKVYGQVTEQICQNKKKTILVLNYERNLKWCIQITEITRF